MRVSFLLHLYQPPTQDLATLKKIADASYIPLIKLLKNKKNLKITLNTPLSFLENLDSAGHHQLIKDLKELMDEGRVEIVGSAAYHPLLPLIPMQCAEAQIILNEYGLGYYFGRRLGFEGEPSVLIKNLLGFFPPELSINNNLLETLDSLGYEWVLVDTNAVPNFPESVYKCDNYAVKIVVRNKKLSDILSFKRDTDARGFITELMGSDDCVIALDGETFGYHNKMGVHLFENLLDSLRDMKAEVVTVGDFVNGSKVKQISEINESTWASTKDEIYPLWMGDKDGLQAMLWEILNRVCELLEAMPALEDMEGWENRSVWNDPSVPESVVARTLALKCMHSDQFWWLANTTIAETLLFSPKMVQRALDLCDEFSDDPKLDKLISDMRTKLSNL